MEVVKVLVAVILVAFLPPLLDGIVRKVKARIQYRVGPPVVQTFYDLEKLFALPSRRPTKSKLFIMAPYLALASAFSAAFLLPYGGFTPTKFSGDVIVFLYVIAMVSVALMLGAFSVRSAYSHIGAHREMMLLLSTEPILAVAIGVFALKAGTLVISQIPEMVTFTFSTVVAYFLLLYSAYAEGSFVPFDIAEAEVEIAGGPLVEYSGRLLGVFLYAILVKRFALMWLVASFPAVPLVAHISLSGWALWLARLITQLVVVLLLYIIAATIEATSARLRIDQAVAINVRMFFAALAVLVVAFMGW